MKRTLIAITAAVAMMGTVAVCPLMGNSVYATTSSVNCSIDLDKANYMPNERVQINGTVTVNGKVLGNVPLIIKILSHNKNIAFVKEVMSDQKGQFSFSAPAGNTEGALGEYVINIFCENEKFSKKYNVVGFNVGGGGGGPVTPPPVVGGGGGAPVTPPGKATSQTNPKSSSYTQTVKTGKNTSNVVLLPEGATRKVEKSLTTINVNKDDVAAMIEQFNKVEGKLVKPNELIFGFKDVKTSDTKYTIPVAALTKENHKNVVFVIESPALTMKVPSSNIVGNDSFTVVSKEINNVAKVALNGDNKVLKSYDFSMNVELAGAEKAVSLFTEPVEVKVDLANYSGDLNRFVLVRLNPNGTNEIVGNRVVEGTLIAKLNHFSEYALVERNTQFADTKGHWADSYIKNMANKGVVKGISDKAFMPQKTLTRAEFVTMLVNSMSLNIEASKGQYADVTASHWAKDYIETARAKGILSDKEKSFRPDVTITRAEMASMISKALNLSKPTAATQGFSDINKLEVSLKAEVEAIINSGIMKGSNGKFRPMDNSTRAEAITVISKVFDLISNM